MADTPSNMLPLGTKAPYFELPNPSHSNEIQSLEDLKGEKGTLVVFMCNHCPFVLHHFVAIRTLSPRLTHLHVDNTRCVL